MSRDLEFIEIVAIGDELLSGATVDSNSADIARRLEPLGLRVVRKAVVGDVAADIGEAVRSALKRTGVVITTGGLGPTPDDVTREAVAAAFGREIEFRPDLWQRLLDRWAPRGRIPETNRKQAEAPSGAEVLPNARGTAPGLALEDEVMGLSILLPGPPNELSALLASQVVPFLSRRVKLGARRPYRRLLRTVGMAESAIAERLGDRLADLGLDVAYLPEMDGNDIRLTGWSVDEAEVGPALEEGVRRIHDILGGHIYGEGEADLAEIVGGLLRERGLRASVAESCTGGLIAMRLTGFPGSSDYFSGGVVAYEDRAKVELLGVSERTIGEQGAVSEATAREMVEGVCRRFGTAAGIAVTGIAGPGGGTDKKPVGTVWLAARLGKAVVAQHRRYPGTRDIVRLRAAQGGLDLLRRMILRESE